MPHGTPDWGLVGPKSTTYGLDDLGEHAVRLGSPHLWDRRGDAIFMTKFAEGLGDVEPYIAGAGDVVALHTRYARTGAFCVRLTAGLVTGGTAGLHKYVPFPVVSLLGMEVSFGCHTRTAYIELRADLRNAIGTWLPELRWDPNAGTIEIRTSLVAWHTVTAVQTAHVTAICSNTIKVVFDIAVPQYVRVIANDQVYSVVGVPVYSTAAVGVPRFLAAIEHRGDAGFTPVAYMDNWIVTQNEP